MVLWLCLGHEALPQSSGKLSWRAAVWNQTYSCLVVFWISAFQELLCEELTIISRHCLKEKNKCKSFGAWGWLVSSPKGHPIRMNPFLAYLSPGEGGTVALGCLPSPWMLDAELVPSPSHPQPLLLRTLPSLLSQHHPGPKHQAPGIRLPSTNVAKILLSLTFLLSLSSSSRPSRLSYRSSLYPHPRERG